MKRRVITGIILTLLSVSMLSLVFNTQKVESKEPPATEWTRTYGGAYNDYAYSVVETHDGGYAMVGNTTSFGAGGGDVWLVKVDSTGNMQWNKTYGGTNDDAAYSLAQTADGGYVMAGTTCSFGAGDCDFWLIKTDSTGNMQWNKTYGGTNEEKASFMIETSDGGYAIAGWTRSFGAGHLDVWLVKVDSTGNMQWNKTYGGTNEEKTWSMIETSDGGYAIAGFTWRSGNRDFWLVKVDTSGNKQWDKTYGGANDEWAHSIVEVSDGGFTLAGMTMSFGAGADDVWLIKVDSTGNMQWNKAYGGSKLDYAHSLAQTADGGYVMVGDTFSFGAGDRDAWLIRVDSSGNMEWNQTYGGADIDNAHSMVQTSDGGYTFAGRTHSFGAGGADFWLVKVGGLPEYTLKIYSSPTGVTFPVDGISRTTPWSGTYSEGTSVSLVMPETHNGYIWSHWLEGGDPNRIKTITMSTNITLTAVYTEVPKPVGGKAAPINVPTIKPELQIPWIWLTIIILSLVATVLYIKKRKRNTEIDY